jgi:hypothetical protein
MNVNDTFIYVYDTTDHGWREGLLQTETEYEIRVRVKTLAEASKVIQMLDKAGYKNVEMGSPRLLFPMEDRRPAEVMRGHFNEAILRALRELEATDKEHAVDVEKIILQMERNPEFRDLLRAHARVRCASKGVLGRTVTMIASAILADKYGLVSYDATQIPRRFWLTKKGSEQQKTSKET